jgi:hypothetical protein
MAAVAASALAACLPDVHLHHCGHACAPCFDGQALSSEAERSNDAPPFRRVRVTRDEYRIALPITPAPGGGWPLTAAARERASEGVRRAVQRLLDALAPASAPTRTHRTQTSIVVRRSRRGCVLQAATAALSVSWFPAVGSDVASGELQVTTWQGIVSLPGSADRAAPGAAIARESTFVPLDDGRGTWVWQAEDGVVYDTDTLVVHCAALLEAQIAYVRLV